MAWVPTRRQCHEAEFSRDLVQGHDDGSSSLFPSCSTSRRRCAGPWFFHNPTPFSQQFFRRSCKTSLGRLRVRGLFVPVSFLSLLSFLSLTLLILVQMTDARVLVAYFSAPGNFERRMKVRNTCNFNLTTARARANYAKVRFFVGRPLTDFTFGKAQGQKAAKQEIDLEVALRYSRSDHSAVSHASMSLCRSGRLSKSSRGGRLASKARLTLAFSIASTSASPAGSPCPT